MPSRSWRIGRPGWTASLALGLLVLIPSMTVDSQDRSAMDREQPARAMGVCPPFQLLDEQGVPIDPVRGENDTVPYSPRKTCGATDCHDYAHIVEGYHFQQGADEPPPDQHATRYAWASSPGNYGGPW